MSEPTPPHHVNWESPEEFASHPHAELQAPPDGRVRRGLPAVADGPVREWVQRFLTFQYVCLGWVFFNATGTSQAFSVLGRLFSGWGEASPLITPLLVLVVFGTIASQYVPPLRIDRLQAAFSRQHAAIQVGLLGFALLGITTFGPVGVAPFIYYRF